MKIIERALKTLENQGKTYYALAKQIGVDKSNIANWKKRKTDPPAKYIPSIALFLGVSEHWLLTGEEDNAYKKDESELLFFYRSMNDEGKEKLLEQASFFSAKYKKHGTDSMVSGA